MKPPFHKAGAPALAATISSLVRTCAIPALLLGGCAYKFSPPDISYDDMTPAVQMGDPPAPVEVVELPKLLPLPGQLKPVPGAKSPPEANDPKQRVTQANDAARVQPVRNGFINAVQVYPFSSGALYQVYAAPGQVTDVALQPGEQLVGSGPVAAGDTVRWIIGDTESGAGEAKRIHILVKPTRAGPADQPRHQHRPPHLSMELRSTEKTYMASVSWQYPQDQLIALRRQNAAATAAQPVATGVDISALNFRYAIEGDTPAVAAAARLRRRRQGLHRIPVAASGRAKCRRSLLLGRAAIPSWSTTARAKLLCRRPALCRRRTPPRRQEQRAARAHCAHRRKAAAMTDGTQRAPEVTPDLRLRAERPRVTRLSRKVLIGLGGAVGLAVAAALIYALQTRRGDQAAKELYTTENRTTAEG